MSSNAPVREARVRLLVLGFSESPETISFVLGVVPTKAWRAGDAVLDRPENRQPANGWMLRSPVDPRLGDADLAVTGLIRMFPDPRAFHRLPSPSRVQVTCTLYG